MKKTLKTMLSATMALTMIGSTAVSVSAYDVCPALGYNDEEVEFLIEYFKAVGKADGLTDEQIELLSSAWGDKDYPNPNNDKESTIIPEWYIKGEPVPDWVIGEYYERIDPDSPNYTDGYKNAFQSVCDASGVTKEEVINDAKIRDSIKLRDDVDFDGEITIKDLAAVKKYLIKEMEFTPVQKYALNDDASVSVCDVARISKKLVEK